MQQIDVAWRLWPKQGVGMPPVTSNDAHCGIPGVICKCCTAALHHEMWKSYQSAGRACAKVQQNLVVLCLMSKKPLPVPTCTPSQGQQPGLLIPIVHILNERFSIIFILMAMITKWRVATAHQGAAPQNVYTCSSAEGSTARICHAAPDQVMFLNHEHEIAECHASSPLGGPGTPKSQQKGSSRMQKRCLRDGLVSGNQCLPRILYMREWP